LLFVQQLVIS